MFLLLGSANDPLCDRVRHALTAADLKDKKKDDGTPEAQGS